MKLLISILVFLLASLRPVDKAKSTSRWVVSENSMLTVNGTTNINRFSCAILRYPKSDTVLISRDKTDHMVLSGTLNLEVKDFDCSSTMMTKQLLSTLKENRFPVLRIRFLSLKEIPSADQRSFVKGDVEIMLSGVLRKFEICYQINVKRGLIELTGQQTVNFSDFHLIPPKKIGMLIQAKDQLVVIFFLKMERVG
ncbi:YceI family protein [Pedobacter psychrodurus]|uniref:YceI family protein n=1 Tax=Pedobacter psychrodurus TaxID=2530456 RepID=A0A4R0PX80_9SPHI|nr:YceI family protein [Pedobacter psychrodurus]TCD23379.1 YceI family protein [Pedobacter psychrodurus]